jgi:hypothetical protein
MGMTVYSERVYFRGLASCTDFPFAHRLVISLPDKLPCAKGLPTALHTAGLCGRRPVNHLFVSFG